MLSASSRVQAFAGRNQVVPGHDARYGLRQIVLETQVAVGQNADQFTHFIAYHRNAPDFELAHDLEGIGEGCGFEQGDGVDNHAALRPFDLADLVGLFFHAHVFVDNADAAFLRHRNGQVPTR